MRGKNTRAALVLQGLGRAEDFHFRSSASMAVAALRHKRPDASPEAVAKWRSTRGSCPRHRRPSLLLDAFAKIDDNSGHNIYAYLPQLVIDAIRGGHVRNGEPKVEH